MTTKETTIADVRPAGVSRTPGVGPLPLYASQPAAGFPSPGDDQVEESLNLHDLLVDNETATFFVRVSGDSMEGLRIFDGDVLVVDRARTPAHQDIVVAAVFGELVVKQLSVTAAHTQLLSAAPGYTPITITDDEDVHVWGVVTGSARTFTKY